MIWMAADREFQMTGPETAKSLVPSIILVHFVSPKHSFQDYMKSDTIGWDILQSLTIQNTTDAISTRVAYLDMDNCMVE